MHLGLSLTVGQHAYMRCASGAMFLAGAPLFAVARVVSAGSAGAAMPLTFSAHFDDHWEFTTHELVFVTEPSVAVSEQL